MAIYKVQRIFSEGVATQREFGLKSFIKKALKKRILTKSEQDTLKSVKKYEDKINKTEKNLAKETSKAAEHKASRDKLTKLVQEQKKENDRLRKEAAAAKDEAKLWKVATAGTAVGGLGLGAAGYAIGNHD